MRIGVNIPTDLMTRLEPLKPGLNVSHICREAIRKRVEAYERAVLNLEGADTEIALADVSEEEIRRRSVIDVDWESLGYQDAANWVKAAGWEDWNEWQAIQGLLERQGRPAWAIQPRLRYPRGEDVKQFDDRRNDFHGLLMAQDDAFLDWVYYNGLETDWVSAEREYGQAWLAYIKAAWERIRQARDAHFNSVRASRLQQRSLRRQPEVPDHLSPGRDPQTHQPFRVVPHESRLAHDVNPLDLNRLMDHPDVDEFFATEEQSH